MQCPATSDETWQGFSNRNHCSIRTKNQNTRTGMNGKLATVFSFHCMSHKI